MKSFLICDYEFSYSDDVVKVSRLRAIFSTNAFNRKMNFSDYFTNDIKVFEDIYKKATEYFVKNIVDTLKLGVEVLMEYGIDYIDLQRLTQLAYDDIDPSDTFEYLQSIADKICSKEDELLISRNLKKMNRGRWYGGGFGLGGAIKGAMMAGGLNLASSAIHGIGDSITNSRDKSIIDKMKNDALHSSELRDRLIDDLYDYCFSVYYSVSEILYEANRMPRVSFEARDCEAKYNNYFERYQKDASYYEKAISALCDCIRANPFICNFYLDFYDLAKGNKKAIQKMTDFFGIGNEYSYYRNDIDNRRIRAILSRPNDSTREIEYKISRLKEISASNPAINIDEHIKSLNANSNSLNKLNHIDTQINELVSVVKTNIADIRQADINNRYDLLWEYVKCKSVYAQYLLTQYYLERYENKQERGYASIVDEIDKYKDCDKDFVSFLKLRIRYENSNQELFGGESCKAHYRDIFELGKKECVSAISFCAVKASENDINACMSEENGVKWLYVAARMHEPNALTALGRLYRKGSDYVKQDFIYAKKMLSIAAEYGDRYAKYELRKLSETDWGKGIIYRDNIDYQFIEKGVREIRCGSCNRKLQISSERGNNEVICYECGKNLSNNEELSLKSKLHLSSICPKCKKENFFDEKQVASGLLICPICGQKIGFNKQKESVKKCIYACGVSLLNSAINDYDFNCAKEYFDKIIGYKDSSELSQKCKDNADEYIYTTAIKLMNEDKASTYNLNRALDLFKKIPDYKDTQDKLKYCRTQISKIYKDKENTKKSIKFLIFIIVAIILYFVFKPFFKDKEQSESGISNPDASLNSYVNDNSEHSTSNDNIDINEITTSLLSSSIYDTDECYTDEGYPILDNDYYTSEAYPVEDN